MNKKQRVGRCLLLKPAIKRAYREYREAQFYAESYPKNALSQMQLEAVTAKLDAVIGEVFKLDITPAKRNRAIAAIEAYLPLQKKGRKIVNDRILFELLERMESEKDFQEFEKIDARLQRYGFNSHNQLYKFLNDVGVAF